MKKIHFIIIGILIYLGCANNTNINVQPATKTIENALKNKELLEQWDIESNRIALLNAIRKADNEGLLPDDYQYNELTKFEDAMILSPDQKENYHKLLTIALINYTSHLKNGKLNPTLLYNDWEIKTKPIATDSIIKKILEKKQVDSLIIASTPKHTIYIQLKKALFTINTMPNDNFDTIKPKEKEKLHLGIKNSNTIAKIKSRLRFWGDLKKNDTLNNTTFDTNLKKAIEQFQSRHGLTPDGKIGKGTLKTLNISKQMRKQQIIANLERWRWYPDNLGDNYLAINLPDYKLQVVENKDTITEYKVVVGRDKRKTPILFSKINNIVFNPTWTVPPTIIKEDLIPEATINKNYFYKSKIKIFNYKNERIYPYNWKPEDALKYKYVQDSGEKNSLGLIKINFNNKHLVYLHDTNHRELFVNHFRALSSGCVRVENPLSLAEYLLKDKIRKEYVKEETTPTNKTLKTAKTYKRKLIEVPIYSLPEIDTIIQKKETLVVKVSQNFGIHFLYFTAWFNKGHFYFREDMYHYDPSLYQLINNKTTETL